MDDEQIDAIAATNLGDYEEGTWHRLFARAILQADREARAGDSIRLQWLVDNSMLFAWVTEYNHGNFSSVRAIGTVNVEGIESADVRKVIDAAIASTQKDEGGQTS